MSENFLLSVTNAAGDVKVLEKIRPIDRKLKYQIDKLIRTAKTGVAGEFCCKPCK